MKLFKGGNHKLWKKISINLAMKKEKRRDKGKKKQKIQSLKMYF